MSAARVMTFEGEPTFLCPGCNTFHLVNVNNPNDHTGAVWSWNGDVEKPTFNPSYHVVGLCHCFIADGNIRFLDDCDHALAGQTVPLPVLTEDDLGWAD